MHVWLAQFMLFERAISSETIHKFEASRVSLKELAINHTYSGESSEGF